MIACEWIDSEWIERLLWCPSQCFKRIRCNGKIYTLYLRWRYEDPWQFYVIEGDAVKGSINSWRFITGDLFIEYNKFFKDIEIKEAEKEAEKIFFEWLEKQRKKSFV